MGQDLSQDTNKDPRSHCLAGQGFRSHQGSPGKSLGSVRRGRWAKGVRFLFVFRDAEEPSHRSDETPSPLQ